MPLAIEQLDLTPYDLIISSSWAFAKGVITGPEQLHVANVHTRSAMRGISDTGIFGKWVFLGGLAGAFVRMALHWVRLWDLRTVAGVDVWVANSSNVSRAHPQDLSAERAGGLPAGSSTDDFPFSRKKKDFYLACSAWFVKMS